MPGLRVGCALCLAAAGAVRAFVNARLWDGTGAARIDEATVLVRNGRIVAVGPAKTVALPAGIAPVDLRNTGSLKDVHVAGNRVPPS